MPNDDSKVSAAILGLFAAIKICRKEGYDPVELLRMVETQCDEWGILEKHRSKLCKSENLSK